MARKSKEIFFFLLLSFFLRILCILCFIYDIRKICKLLVMDEIGSEISNSIDESLLVLVLQSLRQNAGVALLPLPESLEWIPAQALGRAREAMDRRSEEELPLIPENADSAHVTGYHPVGMKSFSRYNQYREGLVLSDGGRIASKDKDHGSLISSLQESLDLLQKLFETIVMRLFRKIEEELQLPVGWFEATMGPTASHSQFHVKRYHQQESETVVNLEPDNKSLIQLLPSHTDPSLISIVFHDRKGRQPGGQGLRYVSALREWKDFEGPTGHGVAVIFVGSVLSYMTDRYYPASQHCVVGGGGSSAGGSDEPRRRMAATYFCRPAPTAILQVPPSPILMDVPRKKKLVTFGQWSSRVARKYQQN